jgi:uncharacterized membrane protein
LTLDSATCAALRLQSISLLPFILIFAAAIVHILPQAAIKGATNRDAFLWWMLLWNGLLYIPMLFLNGPLSGREWLIVGISGLTETVYLLFVSRAYAAGEFSVIYPLARGTAPLLLVLAGFVFLHERPTTIGVAGVVVIVIGIYTINLPALTRWREPLKSLRGTGPRWALAAGVTTAVYTSVDKLGVARVNPFTYLYLVLLVTFVLITPVTLLTTGPQRMLDEFRAAPWRTFLAGATMQLAYVLVLSAMRLGMYASYAGSLRELGVIFATFAGVFLFHEQVTLERVVGAVAIVLGIILIAFRG